MNKTNLLKCEKNKKTICHCESVARGNLSRDCFTAFAMTGECGRSMVEMLGVLAVMGVLSVAGITGYNSAMNRHRANELLNEVQKRAVVVAAQAAQGRETFSISEFSQPNGYTFGVQKYGDKYFFLTLKTSDNKNIDHTICLQMKNSTGSSSTIRKISTNCDMFYFNNDLSKEGVAYDDNIGAKSCQADEECDVITQFCSAGKCISRCAEGSFWAGSLNKSADNCSPGISSCKCAFTSSPNKICSSNEDCYKGTGCCVSDQQGIKRCAGFSKESLQAQQNNCPSTNTPCSTNSDCDVPNEFCSIMYDRSSSPAFPDTGTCLKLESIKTKFIVNGKNVYRSADYMTWWSADNFCKALGKRLMSLSDVGINLKSYASGCSEDECGISDEMWNNIKQSSPGSYVWVQNTGKSDWHAYRILTYGKSVSSSDHIYLSAKAWCI